MTRGTPAEYDVGVKFVEGDREYFARRKEYAADLGKVDLWSVMDHWPLYVGTVNLARSLAIVDLLRSTLNVPGHVAEFGCWRGSTTLLLAKCLRIFDPTSPKEVHVFDSFEGLKEFHAADADAASQFGAYRGSRGDLEDCARLAGVSEDIVIHQGRIEDTLPEFRRLRPEARFSFVYCDTDLYSATKAIMSGLWKSLTIGGLMVFDQWNMSEFPGEGVAVNEFVEGAGGSVEVFKPPFTRQPTLAIRRIL